LLHSTCQAIVSVLANQAHCSKEKEVCHAIRSAQFNSRSTSGHHLARPRASQPPLRSCPPTRACSHLPRLIDLIAGQPVPRARSAAACRLPPGPPTRRPRRSPPLSTLPPTRIGHGRLGGGDQRPGLAGEHELRLGGEVAGGERLLIRCPAPGIGGQLRPPVQRRARLRQVGARRARTPSPPGTSPPRTRSPWTPHGTRPPPGRAPAARCRSNVALQVAGKNLFRHLAADAQGFAEMGNGEINVLTFFLSPSPRSDTA
jgi:hypothetical protein